MELLVYKASAGSGKTFTLAAEYIKHLIRNPFAYRQILAVTFTNKATTEMKERIEQQLYGIWVGDPKSDAYLRKIMDEVPEVEGKKPTVDDVRRQAGKALRLMLHDYSRFRVETIDSFFQSVMRNLARELELSPNLNIELNNAEVLSQAVDSMIEKLTPRSPVLTWLLEYIEERIADDKSWNVAGEVKQFGRNIFDESYLERGETLRQKLKDPRFLRTYRDLLRQTEKEALEQMRAFHKQFEEILDSHTLGEDDLSYKDKGISSYFRKLRSGTLMDKDVMNATLKKHLDSPEAWVSKTHKRRAEIVRLVEERLLPLLREAERRRPERNHTVNSCRLSLKHLNKLQLLNHIDEEVRTLNREHNRFLLSDTTALLHSLMREGDSSFVFEKIGTQIRNVMIDEFQDTSRLQWDNFRLLLLEGLSQGADSLIVGDVKQSIYRWRNGDWGILNRLGSKASAGNQGTPPAFPYPVRVETLAVNWRSQARIIKFNNTLFRHAVEYLNSLHLTELHEACTPLLQAYEDVAQKTHRKEEKGYVKVSFLEPDSEHDYTEVTLCAMGEEVQKLLSKGVKLTDIAILVRKNKNIPAIARYFDKEWGLPVVSDEAFRLDASEAVCLLIEALRLIANPEDIYTAVEKLHALHTDDLAHLRQLPLYDLVEELYRLLHLQSIEKQEGYLLYFLDAVTEYLQQGTPTIEAFLEHWDETLCAKTIPAGEVEGMRIYSIHKSKGLEFQTVLVPFCDWKLENETHNQLVWCSPERLPYSSLDLVPVSYSALMAESVYRQDYLDERLQLWVDNLNLLYVALTRAGGNLVMWSSKKEQNNMAELLLRTLPHVAEELDNARWNANEAMFEFGDVQASEQPSQAISAPTATRENIFSVAPEPIPVEMQSLRPKVEFRQSNRSADFIAGISEEQSWRRFADRGSLLHNLFAHIRTADDIDHALARLTFEGVIGSREQEEELRTLARKALDHPEVAGWYSGKWELFNECDIIWRDEQGKLRNRRPDRVMMQEGEIVVVDFKFGKPRNSYRKQVEGYIRLLRRMGYEKEHITGYLWYVEENRVEQV